MDYKKTSFFNQCQDILKRLKSHSSSWPFRKPVSLEEAPNYAELIEQPMDLETVEKKLEARVCYLTKESFVRDIQLIFRNAMDYNKINTIYHKYAVDLKNYIAPYLSQLKEPTESEIRACVGLKQPKGSYNNLEIRMQLN